MEPAHVIVLRDGHVRNLLREVVQTKGRPVRFTDQDNYLYPGEKNVSIYGWVDDSADEHVRGGACSWIIDDAARLTERTYTESGDTINGNDDVIGINVYPAHCTCGQYQDMHLRHEESFGAVLRDVLNVDDGVSI